MKKRRYFLCVVLLSLALMGNSQADLQGIRLKDFPANSILKTSLNVTSEQELGNIVILPNRIFNQPEAVQIISYLDRLPSSLLAEINRNGIVIKLFTGKLTDNPTASHLSGMIPRGYVNNTTWNDVPGLGGSKTVLVKIGASNKGNGHSSVNLELHELAHSIDIYVFNELRYNRDFLEIWNQEKDQLFPGISYYLTYPEEYFAESFAYYYFGGHYRKELKRKAPLTYRLISKLS
ncbi:MAG TPA: toxin [Bacillus sp. (in: firmicutes)]